MQPGLYIKHTLHIKGSVQTAISTDMPHVLMQAGDGTANGPETTFGGLLMSRRAMMLLSPAKARLAQATNPVYKPAIVQRSTTFNFNAGMTQSRIAKESI
mgnify:CR=1 FL=1